MYKSHFWKIDPLWLVLWSRVTSLLQSSVSHDSSEIILIWWFAAQKAFLIIDVKNSCALNFCENWYFFFKKKEKKSIIIDLITFDPFISSILAELKNLFLSKDPKL